MKRVFILVLIVTMQSYSMKKEEERSMTPPLSISLSGSELEEQGKKENSTELYIRLLQENKKLKKALSKLEGENKVLLDELKSKDTLAATHTYLYLQLRKEYLALIDKNKKEGDPIGSDLPGEKEESPIDKLKRANAVLYTELCKSRKDFNELLAEHEKLTTYYQEIKERDRLKRCVCNIDTMIENLTTDYEKTRIQVYTLQQELMEEKRKNHILQDQIRAQNKTWRVKNEKPN